MIDQSMPAGSNGSGDQPLVWMQSNGDGQPRRDAAGLILDHYAAIYRYAYRLSGSQIDAEDLAQQTFLVAQAKLHQLRDMAKFRPWLFAIVRSCYLKTRRKRAPVPVAGLDIDINSIPEDGMGEEVDRQLLQTALNELPDDFRLVLLMFYFERCSYKEIAEQLGIPIGTVMSRLSRAKGRLRGKLLAAEVSIR